MVKVRPPLDVCRVWLTREYRVRVFTVHLPDGRSFVMAPAELTRWLERLDPRWCGTGADQLRDYVWNFYCATVNVRTGRWSRANKEDIPYGAQGAGRAYSPLCR